MSTYLKEVYPGLSDENIQKIIAETLSLQFKFEPFTLFKEIPINGSFINVDNNGFRISKNQGSWPPSSENLNVFMFGGSTTFGYGVPDEHTIASFLQEFLSDTLNRKIRVYNFGRGSYYSLQERILFEKLLISGVIPDLVIFVDGLNDLMLIDGNPSHVKLFEQLLEKCRNNKVTYLAPKLLNKLPMSRLAKVIRDKFKIFSTHKNSDVSNDIDPERQVSQSEIVAVINRYIENKKIIEAISSEYGIKTLFVWQPVPHYKFDLKYHVFDNPRWTKDYNDRIGKGYNYMEDFIEDNSLGDNFLWLADLQERLQQPLYVDNVHYSMEMSKMLAVEIGGQILSNNLLKKH